MQLRNPPSFNLALNFPPPSNVAQVCRESTTALLPKRIRETESRQGSIKNVVGDLPNVVWEQDTCTSFGSTRDVAFFTGPTTPGTMIEHPRQCELVLVAVLDSLRDCVGPIKDMILPQSSVPWSDDLFKNHQGLHRVESIDICVGYKQVPRSRRARLMGWLDMSLPFSMSSENHRTLWSIRCTVCPGPLLATEIR